jgi:lysophospholipase L1-like esterase
MKRRLKRIATRLSGHAARPTRLVRHLKSAERPAHGGRLSRRRPVHFALLATALACSASMGRAQPEVTPKTVRRAAATTIDSRWRDSFEGFARADRERAPAPGGVLFVGSSSIRLWDGLETQFGDNMHIVKRGFGGSRLVDVTQYLDRLVLPYRPRLIVVYAGDNDLAEGRSPSVVLQSFEAFVEGVHAELPETRIAYVSIKPSPLREDKMAAARATNKLIADYVASKSGLSYIDIFSGMLGSDGHPRRELFRPDLLHLNTTGYALWKAAIRPYLEQGTAMARR